MQLVIVESPTKAKTISKFLGKKYTVKSSYGHIRDLPTRGMGIDLKNNFQPQYIIPEKAEKRVSELKKMAQKSEKVILATDEDREGEAISWHLASALNLKNSEIERIAFHEITKEAITKALKNPRLIDLNLVDAQQARRILDRLVGYELSPFLWKKVRRGLSAGRVQSVALKIIVEREKEIKNFQPEEYWSIGAKLSTKNKEIFEARLLKENGKSLGKMGVKNKVQALKIQEFLERSFYQAGEIIRKEIKKTPPPPYTTSTLQQDANNKFGWSAKQTMVVAQQLYEGIALGGEGSQGLITYMRTDSVNLSMESLLAAQKTIKKIFGEDFNLDTPRFFKNQSRGAQEAHEAIRPTYPQKDPDSLKAYLDPPQLKLYRLIWQRMLASQMSPAILDSVSVDVLATQKKKVENYLLRASGSTIKFEGFLKIYPEKNFLGENILPRMKKDEELDLLKVLSEQKFTQPPARFSEAALIKILEENGIGRPSTYAPTISTLIERNYVTKDENRKLVPQEIGFLVSDLLTEHFAQIVDYKFTAKMEEDLDKIAEGEKKWVPVIEEFYAPFHKNLKAKTKEVKKEDFQEKLDQICPKCGGDLVYKFGRFGKFISCANYPDCRYTQKTEEEEKLAKENQGEICDLCGAPLVVKRGRFGSFLGCSNYPECKNIKKIENKTGVKCPQCLKGEIVQKKSKRGKIFFGCNRYPDCDFALWNKPTGESCPRCQSLLIFTPKNTVRCSNKECVFEK